MITDNDHTDILFLHHILEVKEDILSGLRIVVKKKNYKYNILQCGINIIDITVYKTAIHACIFCFLNKDPGQKVFLFRRKDHSGPYHTSSSIFSQSKVLR